MTRAEIVEATFRVYSTGEDRQIFRSAMSPYAVMFSEGVRVLAMIDNCDFHFMIGKGNEDIEDVEGATLAYAVCSYIWATANDAVVPL